MAADVVVEDVEDLPLEVEDLLLWLSAERGRAPGTIAAYRRDLRGYVGWMRARGRPLAEAVEDDLAGYIAALRDRGLAPASVARAMVPVRALHRFLADEGRAPGDPGAHVELPRVPRGLPKALSEDEVGRLLAAPVGDGPAVLRDRALLEVLYGTGVRVSELVGLSLGDLDLDAALLRAFGKGSKERIVPIGVPAVRALVTWLGPEGRPRMAPARRRRGRVPQPSGRAALAPGGVGRAAPLRPCRGARRQAQPARAPPLLRHPHARPRSGHPSGAGAARPRVDQHHAGVHAGVHGAPVGGVPQRPPQSATGAVAWPDA